jgi:hypothetical protein
MVDWCGRYAVVPPAYSQIVCVIDEIFNRSLLCLVQEVAQVLAGTVQLNWIATLQYNRMKMEVRRTASFCFVSMFFYPT